MELRGAARILASHYQLVICDDPYAFTEDSNWTDADTARGYAGNEHFRMVGTEADLNDHWIEAWTAEEPPPTTAWERITCVHLRVGTGKILVMSVVDADPAISVAVPNGDYALYVSGNGIGVDQLSLGEDLDLSDEELAARKDLEWYRIFIVSGIPAKVGRLDGGT